MTDQPDFDRFTLPRDIPDSLPLLEEGTGAIPQNSPPQGGGAGGGGSDASNPHEESARGYALAHPAGRGWAPECNSPPETEQTETRPGPAPMLDLPLQARFCEHLSHNGNVRLACRSVGVSPQTAYRARRASRAFAACWDAALLIARRHAEEVLAERALEGVDEPVFYHGEEVARRRRYDSRLLLAHLARLDAAAAKVSVSEHDFDDALGALERGEAGPPIPPARPPAPDPRDHFLEPEDDEDEDGDGEHEDDEDANDLCPDAEETCLACGAGPWDACREDMFSAGELADRADPAHWVDGAYHDPVERDLRALEALEAANASPCEEPEIGLQDPVPGVPGSQSSLSQSDGEGDHPKGGGGVLP